MRNTNGNFFWNRRTMIGASVVFPVSLLYGCGGGGNGGEVPTTPVAAEFAIKTHQQMLDWYTGAKFGMFITWGISSEIGLGEWSLNKMPQFNDGTQSGIDAYLSHTPKFNSDPAAIPRLVKLAKDTGMRYIVLVTRHHDGFSLWDSKVSDYASKFNSTKFGTKTDVVKAFADACAQQGIKLVLYYSLLDWLHPDYPVSGSPKDQPYLKFYENQLGDWPRYQTFMKDQLKELLTNYGQIVAIWFDGYWGQDDKSLWNIDDIYKTVNDTQPVTLIGNNQSAEVHPIVLLPGEDFTIGERRGAGGSSDAPGETADTTQVEGYWGYESSEKIQPPSWIFSTLIGCIADGKNFVLNIGPLGDGSLQSEITTGFAIVGNWTKANAEAIYGTRAGVPGLDSTWGTGTDGKTYLYVFVQDPALQTISLPILVTNVQRASMLIDSSELKISQDALTKVINIDLSAAKRVDGVPLVLKLEAT